MIGIASFLAAFRIVPILLAPLTAAALLLIERKRIETYVLALQYTMVAWMVVSPLPVESSLAKLVAGLIATLVLYLGTVRVGGEGLETDANGGFPRGRIFRMIAVLLVFIGTMGVSFEAWMPVEPNSMFMQQSAIIMVAIGILGVSLHTRPFQVGVSLITIVSGFEIIYSSVEPSLAVVALLALVHLGISLVVSYFEIIEAEQLSEGIQG